uniref:Uncharacterized protein n=1 Tax=Romanomermis culicivorax TaxID=13658 RepID=A0A915IZC2_ROMCU
WDNISVDILENLKCYWDLDENAKLYWHQAGKPKEMRQEAFSCNTHYPVGIEGHKQVYKTNFYTPNLARISKVLDEQNFMELEQICKFMPLAYHLAWPHSRGECDFETLQLLSYNFLNSYTRDGQEAIK